MKNGRVLESYPALARPAFARYLTGQMLSGFGTWFQIIAQSLLLIDLTHNGRDLGIAAALQFLPVLVLSPYAGVTLDRHAARNVLLLTATVAMILALVLGVATATHHASVGLVWVLAGCLGFTSTFDRPAQSAMVAELVPLEDRANASALVSVQLASGRLVGPAVAGFVYATYGAAPCFFLNAASFLIIIAAFLSISPRDVLPRVKRTGTRARDELRAGLAYARSTSAVRAPLVCTAIMGAFSFNFLVVMPALISFTYHSDGKALGLCEMLNAGASVIAGLVLAPRMGRPDRNRLALAVGLFAFALVGSSVMPTLLLFALWMPVFGVCFIIFHSTIAALLQTVTDRAYLGRIMSLYYLGMMGTTPFGAPIAGWLIDHVSPRAAMGMGAVAAIGCALWLALVQPATTVAR